ncbi:sugar O-acetyltransferase [Ruegeria sp. HKCCD5849]|nr:sugar O-acetyltransferase [Ruegeria sp. HKCCD7296]NOD46521.1 sugar O-acetyltransferase [Ruegeria sp. HKCCD5849]NOD50179.1 sugar O-acetyltransferase [Ruegeria sp. HKCCD5851]NOD67014.1 sugar O-acetyltransferase [Ruegeria sp. HKCCD7303]NOE41145.1 sugar O-acetyltransferase [Ruegeria sp. HKCCD7319]
MSEREKMQSGQWYCCLDPELDELRARARGAVHAHNTSPPDARGAMAPELRALLGQVGEDCFLEAPFHCAYGMNIHLGKRVYFNAGCVVLDTALVRVGDDTMFGPNVQIYCAQHAKDPAERAQGLEIGLPVTIGKHVWVGGGAILLPGLSIGNNATIGAGSVVTKDVAAGETVVGNPAKSPNR